MFVVSKVATQSEQVHRKASVTVAIEAVCKNIIFTVQCYNATVPLDFFLQTSAILFNALQFLETSQMDIISVHTFDTFVINVNILMNAKKYYTVYVCTVCSNE